MKKPAVEFWGSATERKGCPKDSLPQVAFVGRSNVGKSSLINTLVQRKGLVKTSSSPGKTQLINFFVVNGNFYFVDLPGYGYARVPKAVQEKWGPMIEGYLLDNPNLKAVVLLLDIRHQPTAEDIKLSNWLIYHKIPVLYVVTKADKVGTMQQKQRVKLISAALAAGGDASFVLMSSHTGDGKDTLWAVINQMLKNTTNSLFSA